MPDLRARADALDAYVHASSGDAAARLELEQVLDALARRELDLEWRYVPARPIHGLGKMAGFWMMAVPLSWSDACRVRGDTPPPQAMPPDADEQDPRVRFATAATRPIRLQYCEDHTTGATDWHAHDPSMSWRDANGTLKTSRDVFGLPPREPADAPYTYGRKPMVAVAFDEAATLATLASERAGLRISLPEESEWERAARGWHTNARYPWGDAPAEGRADCDAFRACRVLPSRTFPPNDYGVYAMSGGVWEWCTDLCETASTGRTARRGEQGPPRALRGGSWADAPEACTTTFRMALWPEDGAAYPNVGCRFVLRA